MESKGKTTKTVTFSSDVKTETPPKVITCPSAVAIDLDDPRYNGSPMTALRAFFVDSYLDASIRDVRNSTPFLGPMPAFFRPMSLGAGLGLGSNCQERLVSSVATAVAALSERPLQGVHYTRIIWKVGRFHHISTDLGLEEHVMFALLILKARGDLLSPIDGYFHSFKYRPSITTDSEYSKVYGPSSDDDDWVVRPTRW